MPDQTSATSNLNEQLRAEFEADMRKAFGDDETFERDEHDCYVNHSWRDAFIGYQAAARRQHGSAAQAVDVFEMLGELSRWAPDRYGSEMEFHPDGIYVSLDDVRSLFDTASQRAEMIAPPVADAEGAEDVKDLAQARRLITQLRAALSRRPAAEPCTYPNCACIGGGVFKPCARPVAEQPAAAGNALTDEQSHAEFMRHFPMPEGLRASVYDAWQHDQLRRKEGWEAAIKHLRAAPQAAQGEGLTRDQIRSIFMAHGFTIKEGQTDLKDYVYAAADALLAAHTRASDGKDAERYEYLIDCDYRAAKKYLPNLDEAKHKQGLRSKHDAAMQQAASNQQEGA